MKNLFIIVIMGMVACSESDEGSQNNSVQNNGAGSIGGNDIGSSDALNQLSDSEATALCEKYIKSGGFVKCDNGNSPKYVTVAECAASFSQLPSCFLEAHISQCASGLCAGGPVPPVCDALLSGQCPQGSGGNNGQTSDGKKGSFCHVGGAKGAPTNTFTEKIGNSTECEYKASASHQLSCLYDGGSKEGTCEYMCSQADMSCPTGLSCTTLSKKTITGTNWSACQ